MVGYLILPSFSQAADIQGGSGVSLNWAGYVATGGTYTGVGGSWTMPYSVSATSTLSADATWVGVGGISTNDLIQAGTQTVWQNGQAQYQAWWEALPRDSQNIPVTVHPGDSVTVNLIQQSANTWQISFRNNTTQQNYQTSVTYTSALSSAEWIEEMPSTSGGRSVLIPLDNFNTVTFTGGYAIKNGSQLNLAQAGAQALTMQTSGGLALATTSALNSDGATFSVTRTTNSSTAATGNGWTYYTQGHRWSRGVESVREYERKTNTGRSERGNGLNFGRRFGWMQNFSGRMRGLENSAIRFKFSGGVFRDR